MKHKQSEALRKVSYQAIFLPILCPKRANYHIFCHPALDFGEFQSLYVGEKWSHYKKQLRCQMN